MIQANICRGFCRAECYDESLLDVILSLFFSFVLFFRDRFNLLVVDDLVDVPDNEMVLNEEVDAKIYRKVYDRILHSMYVVDVECWKIVRNGIN